MGLTLRAPDRAAARDPRSAFVAVAALALGAALGLVNAGGALDLPALPGIPQASPPERVYTIYQYEPTNTQEAAEAEDFVRRSSAFRALFGEYGIQTQFTTQLLEPDTNEPIGLTVAVSLERPIPRFDGELPVGFFGPATVGGETTVDYDRFVIEDFAYMFVDVNLGGGQILAIRPGPDERVFRAD